MCQRICDMVSDSACVPILVSSGGYKHPILSLNSLLQMILSIRRQKLDFLTAIIQPTEKDISEMGIDTIPYLLSSAYLFLCYWKVKQET